MMKQHQLSFFAAAFLILFFTETSLAVPVMVEAYGDSITAGLGVLADKSLPAGQVRKLHRKLVIGKIQDVFGLPGGERKVEKNTHRELAWPAVIAGRLQAESRQWVQYANRARPRAKTEELAQQIVRPAQPDTKVLAFFMMAQNDLCQDEKGSQFDFYGIMNSYQRGLLQWENNHQNSTAFIVPVADIPRVYETMNGLTWASSATPNQWMTCQESWERRFPICPYFTHLFYAGQLRNVIGPQRQVLNGSLTELAAKLSQTSRRGNRYVFLAQVEQAPFRKEYFAVDCFHPSALGQRALADFIYPLIVPYFNG